VRSAADVLNVARKPCRKFQCPCRDEIVGAQLAHELRQFGIRQRRVMVLTFLFLQFG
jgi:hypothetical protein